MSQIINLNRVKKAADKSAAKRQADANSVKFGQTKAQKTAEKQKQDASIRQIEGHLRE